MLCFCVNVFVFICLARIDDKVQSESATAEELNAWDGNGKTIDGKT